MSPRVLRKYLRSGMVPWPADWTFRRFNGSTPCDMLVGPCACGATHNENEDWVRDVLAAHDTIIVEAIMYCPVCHAVLTQKEENEAIFECCQCHWNGHASKGLNELPSKIKMPYVSIDLETTGLDPETCQILEIGAIYDNGGMLETLPIFHRYIAHPVYTGEPYALALNAKILRRLSGPHDNSVLSPGQVAESFYSWLRAQGWDGKTSLTPAGKNFASFDKQFLDRLPGFKRTVKLNHRVLDPTLFYWLPGTDERLPDSKTCMERAGIKGKVAHTAVEDAEMVIRLIRIGVRRAGKAQ